MAGTPVLAPDGWGIRCFFRIASAFAKPVIAGFLDKPDAAGYHPHGAAGDDSAIR